MRRVAIVCPGRGSYTEKSLGSLPADHGWVRSAESLRREYDLDPLLELDQASKFEPARHLRPANAAALIYTVTMCDAALALSENKTVCVLGNSMGWYTALAVASALSFEEGFRLVQDMALLQEEGEAGGQVIYPRVDEDWKADPDAEGEIEAALESAPGETYPSIDLGGYVVLAGTQKGVSHLLKTLPKVQLGKTTYPFRLAQHGPYHTPLAKSVGERAKLRLAKLRFRKPRLPLIDGRGRIFSPWSADLAAMRQYTFGDQVATPYDFTASVRVALREFAPERLVLPGPGNSLGGVCAQILIAEGWRGVHSRRDFEGAQEGDRPLIESMRR